MQKNRSVPDVQAKRSAWIENMSGAKAEHQIYLDKSCGAGCAACPYLAQCTGSKDHVKMITRHIWEPYMEICEDIRHTLGMKELYSLRKETIERIFGTAKENHELRYTQMYGKARMDMKVGLTFACMNLKKLAKSSRNGDMRVHSSRSFCLS